MTNLVNIFEGTLKNKNYFYSIPIKPGKDGNVVVNPFISGNGGFTRKFFGDKFYINVNPQSERALIPIEFITKLDHSTVKDKETKKKTKKKVPGGNNTVKYDFKQLFSGEFNGLEDTIAKAEKYNTTIRQKLQDGLDSYSEKFPEKIISDPLNVTLENVIKEAGIEVDAFSSSFTSDHLVNWFIGDFDAYTSDADFDYQDALVEMAEKLHEEMQKECSAPNFLK